MALLRLCDLSTWCRGQDGRVGQHLHRSHSLRHSSNTREPLNKPFLYFFSGRESENHTRSRRFKHLRS